MSLKRLVDPPTSDQPQKNQPLLNQRPECLGPLRLLTSQDDTVTCKVVVDSTAAHVTSKLCRAISSQPETKGEIYDVLFVIFVQFLRSHLSAFSPALGYTLNVNSSQITEELFNLGHFVVFCDVVVV